MPKHKPRSLRRKRLKRSGRLQAGSHWIRQFSGKSIIKGYSKWFGVSQVCAILELRLLGLEVSDEQLDQAKQAEIRKRDARAEQKAARELALFGGRRDEFGESFELLSGYFGSELFPGECGLSCQGLEEEDFFNGW